MVKLTHVRFNHLCRCHLVHDKHATCKLDQEHDEFSRGELFRDQRLIVIIVIVIAIAVIITTDITGIAAIIIVNK